MTSKYTTDGQTITDHQTGLMWDATTFPKMPFYEAMKIAETANAESYKGFSDWRVPTIKELQSIVDFACCAPACDPVFNAAPAWYWSSTTFVPEPAIAWFVYFNFGSTSAGSKHNSHFVRLVRNGQ